MKIDLISEIAINEAKVKELYLRNIKMLQSLLKEVKEKFNIESIKYWLEDWGNDGYGLKWRINNNNAEDELSKIEENLNIKDKELFNWLENFIINSSKEEYDKYIAWNIVTGKQIGRAHV